MNVREILVEYLESNGFDGLVCSGECGCDISDLIPCENNQSACEPGYRIPDKTGEFDYLITTKKPA